MVIRSQVAMVAVRLVWITASNSILWSRMRPRMGFALVRTSHHAGVSTRVISECEARSCWGAADRRLSCTSTFTELF